MGLVRRTALTTIVLEMETVAPRQTLETVVQPMNEPTLNPAQASAPIWMAAVNPEIGMISRSLRALNSKPTANMTSTTPTSASSPIRAGSANNGTGMYGPTMRPASR